jgi:hypothetical protein
MAHPLRPFWSARMLTLSHAPPPQSHHTTTAEKRDLGSNKADVPAKLAAGGGPSEAGGDRGLAESGVIKPPRPEEGPTPEAVAGGRGSR